MNTNRFTRALCTVLGVAGLLAVTAFSSGCNENKQPSNASADEPAATYTASTDDEANPVDFLESIGIDAVSLGIEPNVYNDTANKVGFQLDAPDEGDTIATIHTSMGDITIRFFPTQAPKAVTNFINLAKDGKYNNTLFSKVTKDFMINGGYCGTSSYGSQFEDEFCNKLFNIRGAVAMSNTGCDTNESAFFINQTSAEAFKSQGGWTHLEEQWSTLKKQFNNYKDSNLLTAFIDKNGTNCYNTDIVPNEVKQLYNQHGGNPYLDGAYNAVDRGYTVFAQVIDGMDVVDKIAQVKTNEEGIPNESVIIESVEITAYSGNTAASTAK